MAIAEYDYRAEPPWAVMIVSEPGESVADFLRHVAVRFDIITDTDGEDEDLRHHICDMTIERTLDGLWRCEATHETDADVAHREWRYRNGLT